MRASYATRPRVVQRFWSHVEFGVGECVLWCGAKTSDGYGRMYVDGKMVMAHRIAYEIFSGETLPDDRLVCHTCDTPGCVTDGHLFVGTASDNMRDSVLKGRAAPLKLTLLQVRELKQRYAIGSVTQVELAREYGIHPTTVGQILSGRHYSYVS